MASSRFRFLRARRFWLLVLVFATLASSTLFAQYQRKPPDFGGSYVFPTPTHPEPRSTMVRGLDMVALGAALASGAWLVLKRRSRNGVLALSIASLAYFGFYRKGCICPIGAIQSVTISLVDSSYIVSRSIIVFFFLPLVAALLFGRIFCGGVCPLGAIQDLVLLRPKNMPERLDRALSWLRYAYLAVAVLFAGWGLNVALGSWQVKIGRRFLICEWDPFVGIFRLSGPFHMILIGLGLLLLGMFYGRPYCRWLCPYGALLSILSRFAWKNVQITPDRELDCGLCADACPYGAIHNLRADRADCLACARCYEYCPRQVGVSDGRGGEKELVQLVR